MAEMLTADFTLDSLPELARRLAAVLRPGDLVLLEGELGAGKTTLTRAVCGSLGADPGVVSSPTFTLMQEYEAGTGTGTGSVGAIVHIDAYRLSGSPESASAELEQLGFTAALAAEAVTIVEWPGRLDGAWATFGLDTDAAVRVSLDHAGPDSRAIEIATPAQIMDRPGWTDLRRFVGLLTKAGDDAEDAPPRTDTTCPVTGRPVPASSPTWPFADERARMADLYRWFSDGYQINRPMTEADLEQGE